MLHSLSVLVRPENVDVVVWCAESLHALVALHAVVQGGSHAVNAKVRVFDENGVRPFSCLLGVG